MPYTPPSHHSPVPSVSQASTHLHHQPESNQDGQRRHLPRSPSGTTSSLPRSRSSSTASRKREDHDTVKKTDTNTQIPGDAKQKPRCTIDTSLRPSSPPLTDSATMSARAITSPPDSAHSSSDEGCCAKLKLENVQEIKDLEEAVRSMQINRGGSPDPNETFRFPSLGEGEGRNQVRAAKLTNAARKIAHSRSTTDTAIVFTPLHDTIDFPAHMSVSDGSDDDMSKPALIRKKSGELVKPAIRPRNRRAASSMPGTPTYGKKGVHFNDDIQQVRHFLQVDRPIAVSAGGSPADTFEDEREFPFAKAPPSPMPSGFNIRLCNFPRQSLERQSQPVRLDQISLSVDQKSLLGQVVVANLSFHKTVIARFTTDFWKTTSEVLGDYRSDPSQKPSDGFDMFNFSIKLSDVTNIEQKTMFICVRYLVNGQEHWDNNNSLNYQVDFTQRQPVASSAPGLAARPIPRSRKSSVAPSRTRHQAPADEDFSDGFENRPGLKLKQPAKDDDLLQARSSNRSSQQFSTRYDFGASLTAALSQAQSTLGDRSGLRKLASPAGNVQHATLHQSSVGQRQTAPLSARHETPRPDALHANQTSLDSRAYQEFVSKFCFFGSGKPHTNGTASHDSSAPRTPKPQPPTDTDGASDEKPPVPARAPERPRAQQEPDSRKPPRFNEQQGPGDVPQLRAGSPSLSPVYGTSVGYGSRSSSPTSLGYRFGQSIDYGLMGSGSATPATAIHG